MALKIKKRDRKIILQNLHKFIYIQRISFLINEKNVIILIFHPFPFDIVPGPA